MIDAEGTVTWSAEFCYHGAYGVEAQILRNGELSVGRRFPLKEHASGGPRGRRPTRANARSSESGRMIRSEPDDDYLTLAFAFRRSAQYFFIRADTPCEPPQTSFWPEVRPL